MTDKYLSSLLGEHEGIVLVTRQHWLVLLGEILIEALLTVAIIVLVTFILVLLPVPNPLVALGYALLLLPLVSMGRDYVIWGNRKYIVTSRRVIQLSGVFSKNVTDSSLEKVNDVKMEQSFLGRLLDYGDIEILTASELGVNLFRRIGGPIRFKTAMLNAKERLEQEQAGGGPRAGGDAPALIARLDELRKHGVLTEEEFQKKKAELLAKI
jgi:uncharacterized membrane protein YdbT with pleckstrin-like domain